MILLRESERESRKRIEEQCFCSQGIVDVAAANGPFNLSVMQRIREVGTGPLLARLGFYLVGPSVFATGTSVA
ncbi:hypothetical protein WN944_008022 [Citrus x changshan-huyou]|uniref:Uncharacterized protein n=1 Tax=Citrus x changshan-huyou TaxID=2935761 RepID=A0AAP0QUW7_9ROSI